jgi:hypothetical protein
MRPVAIVLMCTHSAAIAQTNCDSACTRNEVHGELRILTSTPSVGVMITPNNVNFGNVRLGEVSERLITITNTSSASTLSGSIGATDFGSAFEITNCGGAFDLGPNEKRVFSLEFEPTFTEYQQDSVIVAFDGELYPITIRFAGSGVVPSGSLGQNEVIGIEPAVINFGRAAVGESRDRQVTIRNLSPTARLNGSVGNPSSPFLVHGGAVSTFSLAPNESRTLTLSYSPQHTGSFTDNLTINYLSDSIVGNTFVRLAGSVTADVSGIDDARAAVGDLTSYPEPTSNDAVVHYAAMTSGNVRIAVYDARGREVSRLFDDYAEAGEHTIRWDGTSQAAGVYHVRVITSDGASTGRITLVR